MTATLTPIIPIPNVPVSDLELASLRVTATTRAWVEHLDVCESVREFSVPCQVCWELDRVADDAAFEYERQQHRARRAHLRLVSR